jgi:hypothetical protein
VTHTSEQVRAARWLTLAAAVLLLNASLAFENVWPTPAITWRGLLSIEFTVFVLVFAVWRGTRRRRALAAHRAPARERSGAKGFPRATEPGAGAEPRFSWLSATWVLLVLGHYGDVTAPALYGRDINLYWDARFMPDVAAMITRVAPWWLIGGALAASALALLAIYLVLHWSLKRLASAIDSAVERRVVLAAALAAAAWYGIQFAFIHIPKYPGFARPVIPTYARQARLAFAGLTASVPVTLSPPMNSDLSLVKGADVLLIFIESYGAVTYDRPEFARPLTASRADLERAIHDTGRASVSAFVESTTFGGSSWLAHISLLSGVEVRDHETNAALMRQKRQTLASLFAQHGYRTIALMPGLKLPWPEGSFYGFSQTYNAERLQYPGPEFGWFDVPDQFSLAWFDKTEVEPKERAPLFVFFPTLSTHFPFSPTPPYQPDWPRILSDRKFDTTALLQSYAETLDWVDFGPAYVNAMAYSYSTVSGYLRQRSGHDFVMILAGDHQPPAAVSGEGSPWDVPVHIITSRREVLERLKSRGFAEGLAPPRPPLTRIDKLLPIFLDSFGDRE